MADSYITEEELKQRFRQVRMEHDTRLADTFVAKDGSKVLSDNNYTTAEKDKLASLDLEQLATKADLETIQGGGSAIDTSQFVTETELQTALNSATVDTSQFATKSDLETIQGGSYTLPAADDEVRGGVRVTGENGLYMSGDEIKLNIAGYGGYLGGVRVTGQNGLYMDGDEIKLDKASSSRLGGVRVTDENGLYMDDDEIKLNDSYVRNLIDSSGSGDLPVASYNERGGVIVTGDNGLYMDGSEIKLDDSYVRNLIDSSGSSDDSYGIQTGEGLYIDSDGSVWLDRARPEQLGGVRVTGNDGLVMDGFEIKLDFSPFIVNGKLQITVNGTTYTFTPDA